MNKRNKILLLTFIGLGAVISVVTSYPVEETGDIQPSDNHHHHNHRRGGGHRRWGEGGGCRHKSDGGNWHHHHNHEGGYHHGWHGSHEGNHHWQGSPPSGRPPYNPNIPQQPLNPEISKKPEIEHITPTTPHTAQKPIQPQKEQDDIDETISSIFKPDTANRIDDKENIRPLVDVRVDEPGRPAGVPSISDLVLTGDFSKIK